MPKVTRTGASPARSAAALGAVVLGLGLLSGCGGGSNASAERAASQGGQSVPAPVPAPAAAPAPAAPKVDNTAPGGLDDAAFWRLIAETRSAAGNDTGRQSELLKDRLTKLSPASIVEFARIRHRLDARAYTWNLWGAAYMIEDGCSDDCFRDFRGYVISLGRGPYESALGNPDSLASVAQDAEAGDWENADNAAPDAYSSVTGNDFPLDDSDLSGRPRGTPFNENSRAALARRYPRLAARFRT
jgi:uncharacterized protein DUF4240